MPGRLAVGLEFIGVVIGHERAVVEQAEFADDVERIYGEVPTGGADADRAGAGEAFERVGGAEGEVALGAGGQPGVGLVDPGMDADLVAGGGDAADFVGVQQGGNGGIEEAGRNGFTLEQREDAWHGAAIAVLALADAHRAFVGVAERDGVVISVERDRHGAACAAGPGAGGKAAAGAGSTDDASPCGFRPLPGFAVGVGRVRHGDKIVRSAAEVQGAAAGLGRAGFYCRVLPAAGGVLTPIAATRATTSIGCETWNTRWSGKVWLSVSGPFRPVSMMW